LDRIGPAIILTHSQSGPFGWLIADARPNLVKAIVALEPSGPPFEDPVLREGAARECAAVGCLMPISGNGNLSYLKRRTY
jgi:pimeloyl-ACP methyl ester carboxylesterase